MLTALSLPGVKDVSKEIAMLTEMLDRGLSFVHLRKPALSMDLMGSWLGKVPRIYRQQIVWYLPYSILGPNPAFQRTAQRSIATTSPIEKVVENVERFVSSFEIRRVHVPGWFREKASIMNDRWHELLSHELSYSTSIHHMKELEAVATGFGKQELTLDYVTLSPVFDSLSKIGYKAGANLLEDVSAYKKAKKASGASFPVKILGLGGVHSGNMDTLKENGFDGAVLNGCLWHLDNSAQMTLHQFKACYKKWRD